MTEMTQREAVRRAWAAAESASNMLGDDCEGAVAFAEVSRAWAAVASQLPFAEDGGELLDARTLVPVPRPLERREPTNTQTAAELAAADAALRGEPVDETLVMSTVAIPVSSVWGDETPRQGDRTECRCGEPIAYLGGAWVHNGGKLHCEPR